jgi:hypothetical protein
MPVGTSKKPQMQQRFDVFKAEMAGVVIEMCLTHSKGPERLEKNATDHHARPFQKRSALKGATTT